MHTSVRSIDHLSDVINMNWSSPSSSSSSQCDDIIRLHRTKCTALIKNVIAPSLLLDLIKDVGDSAFSVIVDESTDISTEKLLSICIKYYSKKNDVITQFLNFVSVVSCTAEDLFEAITNYFKSINLKVENLIGIGTDGAANLCGKKHSLFTSLKTRLDLKHLVLLKCICHSLHLCASRASEVFF